MRIAVAGVLVVVGCAAAPSPRARAPGPPVVRPQASLVLPGACVDPVEDAMRRLGPDADREGVRSEQVGDLDGDGAADPMIADASFCGTSGCTWHLYVARGSCAHHVGEVFGLLPLARPEVSAGLADVVVSARDGCGGLARTEVRARYDGEQYLPFETRRCRCPEGEEDPSSTDADDWCDGWEPVRAPADG